jgi:hypothetical protein
MVLGCAWCNKTQLSMTKFNRIFCLSYGVFLGLIAIMMRIPADCIIVSLSRHAFLPSWGLGCPPGLQAACHPRLRTARCHNRMDIRLRCPMVLARLGHLAHARAAGGHGGGDDRRTGRRAHPGCRMAAGCRSEDCRIGPHAHAEVCPDRRRSADQGRSRSGSRAAGYPSFGQDRTKNSIIYVFALL